jgi:hypothetical protein
MTAAPRHGGSGPIFPVVRTRTGGVCWFDSNDWFARVGIEPANQRLSDSIRRFVPPDVIPIAVDFDLLPFHLRHGPACPGHPLRHSAAIVGPDKPDHDDEGRESVSTAIGINP